MSRKQAAKQISRLVDQMMALNQAEASRIAAMGFKLNLPVELAIDFRANTQEHATALAAKLKDLGFSTPQVTLDNRDWNISSTIKMPVTTFISEPFTKRLAIALFTHNCSLREWHKQYIF